MSDFNFSDWARLDSARPSTYDSFTSGAKAAQGLQDHINTDKAIKALQANPNDQSALTALARYNPAAAASVRADNENAMNAQRREAAQALAQNAYDSQFKRAVPVAQAPVSTTPVEPSATPSQLSRSLLTPMPESIQPTAPSPSSPLAALATSGQSNLTPLPPVARPMADASHLAAMAGHYSNLTPQPSALDPVEAPVAKTFADHDHPESVAIGKAVVEGRLSLQEAYIKSLSLLSPEEANSVVANLTAMDAPRRAQLLEQSKAMGEAAYAMLSPSDQGGIPDDGGANTARHAWVQSHKAELMSHGITEEQINNADLSNTSLQAMLTQAIGITGMIEQENKKRDDARLSQTALETERHNRAIEGKPIATGDGTMIDPSTGKVVYDPYGSGGGNSGGSKFTGGFDSFNRDYLAPVEGGYVASDGRSNAPSNYGVNQKANPDINVRALTPESAAKVMYDRYWVPSGANRLSGPIQAIQADTAINMGVPTANRLLAQSGGDPAKYLALREQRYRSIGGRDLNGWLARNEKLANFVGIGGGGQSSPSSGRMRPNSMMTPEQKTAYGLDPKVAYHTDNKGNPVVVSGQKSGTSMSTLGDANATGPDVYKSLSPSESATVKAVVDGRLAIPTGRAAATPYWQGIMDAAQRADPTLDSARQPARVAAVKAFTGDGKAAQNLGSFNRFGAHVGSLAEINEKLAGPETGFGPLNTLVAGGIQSFQPQALAQYNVELDAVAGEFGKLVKRGVVTQAEIERYIDHLRPNQSLSTRRAALGSLATLVGGAMAPLQQQWNSAFTNKRPPIAWLSIPAYTAMRKLDPETFKNITPPVGYVMKSSKGNFVFRGGDVSSATSWARSK